MVAHSLLYLYTIIRQVVKQSNTNQHYAYPTFEVTSLQWLSPFVHRDSIGSVVVETRSRPQSPRSFWPVAGIELWLDPTPELTQRFTDFPSNLANRIGWEYKTNTLRILRKSGRARSRDPCHRHIVRGLQSHFQLYQCHCHVVFLVDYRSVYLHRG